MISDPDLSLALLNAHAALWLRTGELLQENQARWLALAERMLALDADGQALAALPVDAQWRPLGRALALPQELTLTAIDNQAAFGAGMQCALAQWQLETAQALSKAPQLMPFSGALKSVLRKATEVPR